MMKKFYDKSELWFALAWIIGYCLLASIGDNLSAEAGLQKVFTLPILIALSVAATVFVTKNRLHKKYGLCRSDISASKMLFYIPVLVLLTANLWYGVTRNTSPIETVLYILSMLCVGYLEELIFRGFLFRAMAKNGIRSAIIVSSVTFGIGHIINLFNGSGAELIPNLLQVVYAMAVGFMFVMIFYRTNSLIPCILTHSIFNSLSIFSNNAITMQAETISCVLITLLSGAYAVYLALTVKNEQSK
jgi:membrane protease YdiL (CAAX protease family)